MHWDTMYGTSIFGPVFPATVCARVIAGSMWAPEVLPRRRMRTATIAPKENPIIKNAWKEATPPTNETVAVVQSNKDKHVGAEKLGSAHCLPAPLRVRGHR